MNVINKIRLFLIVWSALMISAIESVGIRTEGQVELENSSKNAYAQVLLLTTSSFLADAAWQLKNIKKTWR